MYLFRRHLYVLLIAEVLEAISAIAQVAALILVSFDVFNDLPLLGRRFRLQISWLEASGQLLPGIQLKTAALSDHRLEADIFHRRLLLARLIEMRCARLAVFERLEQLKRLLTLT